VNLFNEFKLINKIKTPNFILGEYVISMDKTYFVKDIVPENDTFIYTLISSCGKNTITVDQSLIIKFGKSSCGK
jgi:hypothetical protein